jgi:hypothetical protein
METMERKQPRARRSFTAEFKAEIVEPFDPVRRRPSATDVEWSSAVIAPRLQIPLDAIQYPIAAKQPPDEERPTGRRNNLR